MVHCLRDHKRPMKTLLQLLKDVCTILFFSVIKS